ncbi:hypothetical protein AJ88_05095 [Mesorhizobium amorphae CCBAU 01583]|nr:hypothetical protein AJ88_05095 [Mesorhizobium amorphae CCBAU 01583]
MPKLLLSPFRALAARRTARSLVIAAPNAVQPARNRSPTGTIEGKFGMIPAKAVLADDTLGLMDSCVHRKKAAPKPTMKMPTSARTVVPIRRARRIVPDHCERRDAR